MRASRHLKDLRQAVAGLTRLQNRRVHRLALRQQPFDSLLLQKSALYLRSRELTLQQQCVLEAALLSSPRSLGGPILLENRIQYSPTQDELLFAALDPRERGARLAELRTFTTSVFHEQSHRILWTFLPPPVQKADAFRQYLNYTESLVVMTDMALSDQLGENLARSLYLVGSIYDPGSSIRKTLTKPSDYRRYLLAAMFATYLNLELYEPRDIEKIIAALFGKKNSMERACRRALNLDRQFVLQTNPIWQHRNQKQIQKFFGKNSPQRRIHGKVTLDLGDDPFQPGIAFFWAERWLDHLNIR